MNRNCKYAVNPSSHMTQINQHEISIDFKTVVTIKDVVNLERHTFSDEVDLKKPLKFSTVSGEQQYRNNRPKVKMKMIKFSEKFKSPNPDQDSFTNEINNSYLKNNFEQKIKIKENFDPD